MHFRQKGLNRQLTKRLFSAKMSLSFFQPNPLEAHMKPNLLIFVAALVFLTGCDSISPFVGAELKARVCDRDSDGLPRASDECAGNDCDDGDENVGVPTSWYRDVDTDTFGAGEASPACAQLDGFVALAGDCELVGVRTVGEALDALLS